MWHNCQTLLYRRFCAAEKFSAHFLIILSFQHKNAHLNGCMCVCVYLYSDYFILIFFHFCICSANEFAFALAAGRRVGTFQWDSHKLSHGRVDERTHGQMLQLPQQRSDKLKCFELA